MKNKLIELALIWAFVLTGFVALARADNTLSLPVVGTLDLTNFVHNAGAIDTIDNHGVNRAGVSVRGLWYPNDAANASNPADQAWVAGEAMVTWDTTGGSPSGLGLWAGFRADTIGAKLFGFVPSVGHLVIPSVELGPTVMYIENNSPKQHIVAGGAFAAHW